jgi:hypothetical protein
LSVEPTLVMGSSRWDVLHSPMARAELQVRRYTGKEEKEI